MATAGCHIDVREGHISFEVEGRFPVFGYKEEDTISPHSSILDALSLFPEYDVEDTLSDKDHPNSEWISYGVLE